MTREEAIFCEGTYLGENNCINCKYYARGTCESRKSHKMAIEALKAEPCEDAVSRPEVLNQIFYSTDNSGDVVLGSTLRHRIEKLPPVTPKPRTGKWIENTVVIDEFTNEEDTFYVCGCCNERICQPHKYCPNCGAKMEGE